MTESQSISDRTPPVTSHHPHNIILHSINHNNIAASEETYATHSGLYQSNVRQYNPDNYASTNADLPAVLTPQRSRHNSTPRPIYYKSPSSVASPSLATAVRTPGTTTPVHRALLGGHSRRSSGMGSTHDGVNPHAAADLLRQAMMHR